MKVGHFFWTFVFGPTVFTLKDLKPGFAPSYKQNGLSCGMAQVEKTKTTKYNTQMLHGTGIFTYIWLKLMVNIPYMEHLGYIDFPHDIANHRCFF